ncbi:MAG: VOC family protein [Fuerstiella sp.]
MTKARFRSCAPYQENVLALPVIDIDAAAEWYSRHFAMTEVSRSTDPVPAVILERDGQQIGFAINGGDPGQEGAAVLVDDIEALKKEMDSRGTPTGDFRIDDRDGKKYRVFFVVAPDGLCYYFHEPLKSM